MSGSVIAFQGAVIDVIREVVDVCLWEENYHDFKARVYFKQTADQGGVYYSSKRQRSG
jgi:hypothetical protein